MATGQNSTVYSVQGLHPFSVYSFKVAAVNGVGLSRESDQSYYMITLREVSGIGSTQSRDLSAHL